ncbi:tetraacyldisaccharide 4'-kinase [candidate division KSB3 bacterium]|uniref:Tetraacyldisaccharide 4'-kinase n=1 Tax=candidate division KSB3 bacterium TaxID=2044937 RepID=A0A2G6E614_9BACT|nr:MAG: tetraacyldisaccharide 4'-kinase [candidate division KSB3 bacterium]PIE30065.1 MAG: tetraacyldisaccharide 4'-kinase [candidate division KSB3 bacterium]
MGIKYFFSLVENGKPAFPDDRSPRILLSYALRRLVFSMLFGCSFLYQSLVWMRAALYRCKIFTPARLPCLVISVGNITTGGTGKTPAVIEIACLLAQHGTRVAVLSRGYRRTSSFPTVIVEPDSDVSQTGDEPLLMARKFQRVFSPSALRPAVLVGSRRYRSGLLALERFQSEVILLDDGFQHLQLARDCDVVLIDAARPFGSGNLLPAGCLREPLVHLRRATAFIVTRSDEAPDLQVIRRTLKRINPAAPVFNATHAFNGFRRLGSDEPVDAEALLRQRLLAVSGLGNPASFHHLLNTQGFHEIETLVFPDHHAYREQDGLAIARLCHERRLNGVMTSEKDEMKLLPRLESVGIAGYVAMIRLTIHPEKEFREMLFSYI